MTTALPPAVLFGIFVLFLCAVQTEQQQVAVATFSDPYFQTVNTNPQAIASGDCVLSGAFGTYYSVSVYSSSIDYAFGCNVGACGSGCALSGQIYLGSCLPLAPLSSSSWASAWMLEEGPVVVTAYSDFTCSTVLSGTTSATVSSGSCSYSTALATYFQVLAIADSQLLYGVGCDSACSGCQFVGMVSLGQCVPLGGGGTYVRATAPPGSKDDGGIPTWAIVVIVVGAAASVVAVVLSVLALAYRYYRKASGYRSLADAIGS
jgi:hypothetical protein